MIEQKDAVHPGTIVLFGSGETSSSGRKIFEQVLRELPFAAKVALLETPAGFELNSAQVIGRIAEFLQVRLQNYQPQISIIPARRRDTPFSPDNPQILTPLFESDLIFMGPGSPTYAVRQLNKSLAWQYILARHRLGATLVLASAAAIAISAFALPVYEIYKVGEDIHWKPGLDLFGFYGFPLVFIPHWNNNDGGDELDTSRCFMGEARFAELMNMLPESLTVIGIDEKTALIMDPKTGVCQVSGKGSVTLLHSGHGHPKRDLPSELQNSGIEEVARRRNSHVHQYSSGQSFPLSECCPFQIFESGIGINPAIWREALEWQEKKAEQTTGPAPAPPEVLRLVEERQTARQKKDWQAADALRLKILDLGWQVLDTPEGPRLDPIS